METLWLTRLKRLQALAATGQHFTRDGFDRERYEEIDALASAMLADLFTKAPVPIPGLPKPAHGYATPHVEVRGAVIRDGRILLVREAMDGLWALPGGYCDIGLSAAENVEKEIQEEAGLTARARHLYLIRHRAKGPFPPDPKDFYKIYFLCDEDGQVTPRPAQETTEAAFFAPDALPPLSPLRVHESDIMEAFRQAATPGLPVEFDRTAP
ncbi:NUDIX hydrolase [Pseudoruegeria sp. SHC-113]|uniref:NUDIX hydrolase n=1 Tax=Pseudoruegeria sp. SHC-113 TaxID=2855439 RepID=UPI0021BACB40|nr:NUDIX hydrolase [Pseudoruegeria sp. SHC-113]MCT8158836.1 NUDIX hydrolase [Pseudoruegeria sp. SHC-113]